MGLVSNIREWKGVTWKMQRRVNVVLEDKEMDNRDLESRR